MTLDLQPADRPTIYFIGLATGKSSIMKVFPAWANYLELGNCKLQGIDLKLHDDPEAYRKVISFIKSDPNSLGAVVTTHKMDLLKAAGDLFDHLEHYAQLMGEVSCISKRGGKLIGDAKDPITSNLTLDLFLPKNHWSKTGAEILVLGAGGSSIAFTSYLMEKSSPSNRPSKIIITNRSTPHLEEIRTIHEKVNPGILVEYLHTPHPEDCDQAVARLKPGSLVVNATGLGKDAPGSPLTNAVNFPEDGFVWDFNCRGQLIFLDQARAQQNVRRLTVEDGWIYFIYGWTRHIAEIFNVDIPISGPEFDEISGIAASVR